MPPPPKAEAGAPTSEGKTPTNPFPSRQNSTQEPSRSLPADIKPPSPPSELLIDISSNTLIGAEAQPSTQQPPTTPQTSHPTRPNLVHSIAQSTSQMTQYAAQLTAQQQHQVQVPGVTYTLNPTAEAFAPSSPGEKEDRQGEE